MSTYKLLLLFSAFVSATAYAGGHMERYGYPVEGVTYKFEVYTDEKDRWDSAKQDAPPLPPGKAVRTAEKFVQTVPLRDDMKEWSIREISLLRLSPSPDEQWVYVVHFSADPKAGTWNGPVPWIDVPVRMDGTIPEPLIERKKS